MIMVSAKMNCTGLLLPKACAVKSRIAGEKPVFILADAQALAIRDFAFMDTKRCTKCGLELPTTTEYFRMRGDHSGRLESQCRNCERAYSKTSERKSYMREYQKAWRKTDKGQSSTKAYRQTEAYRLSQQARVKTDETKERARVKAAKRRQTSEGKAYQQAYYRSADYKAKAKVRRQIPQYKAYQRKYWLSPKGRTASRVASQRRRARVRCLPSTFTLQDWEFALSYFSYRCAICDRPTGLWHTLAQDHWIPVAKGGSYTSDNIIPTCHGVGGCNNTRLDRDPIEWITEKFGARKAKRIINRILTYFASLKEAK